MATINPDASQTIDALSVASEFIMCAIRSLANGGDPGGREVQDPLRWALAKLNEGMRQEAPNPD